MGQQLSRTGDVVVVRIRRDADKIIASKLVALFAAAVVTYASAQVAGTGSSVNTDACVLADGPDVR